MSVQHNERCPECKKRVFELLSRVFGEVKQNHDIRLSSKLNSFKDSPFYSDLQKIFVTLQKHRGYREFVGANKLSKVDLFVVKPGFIVEFDESQHFTKPRAIVLRHYPVKMRLGFDKDKWIRHCEKLDRHDNDPVWRDETRAWYDTIRDFAPSILNLNPTVRIFARDVVWCDFDLESDEDINRFKEIIGEKV